MPGMPMLLFIKARETYVQVVTNSIEVSIHMAAMRLMQVLDQSPVILNGV